MRIFRETTVYSATEAAEAMYYMGLAGWDCSEMVDGLSGVLNLAAASGRHPTFDGTALPLPDSYDVSMSDVEADSGGETEAGTYQRDVVRFGIREISVKFSVSKRWLGVLTGFKQQVSITVDYFDPETVDIVTTEMYISDDFLEAVQKNTRNYYWSGTITTTDGTVYEFDYDDILKGSGYITAQCCGSTEIELGGVYSAELGITLFSDVDRYTLEDAIITLSCFLRLSDGNYEEVPMGIFEMSEANQTLRRIEITAYDYMLRFEEDFNGFQSTGTAYDFINLCCTACSVEMAQTQDEFPSAT